MSRRARQLVEPVAGWLWPASACVVVAGLLLVVKPSAQLEVGLVVALLLGAVIAWRERRLWTLCLSDPLTGLPNRRGFQRRFEVELQRARRDGASLALVLIDCDRFKQINDTHGHAVGDQALETLTRALRLAVRSEDVVGRWGGDEFVVLLRGVSEAEVRRIAMRVNATLKLSAGQVRFTVSCGCVLSQARTAKLSNLLTAADEALYEAKRRGGAQLAACREPSPSPFDVEQHTPPLRGS